MVLERGAQVHASDEKVIGHLTHVLGDLQEDIFDGIAFKHGLHAEVMLPQSAISKITRRGVFLNLSEGEVQTSAQAFKEEKMFKASEGGRGRLRWKKDEDDEYF